MPFVSVVTGGWKCPVQDGHTFGLHWTTHHRTPTLWVLCGQRESKSGPVNLSLRSTVTLSLLCLEPTPDESAEVVAPDVGDTLRGVLEGMVRLESQMQAQDERMLRMEAMLQQVLQHLSDGGKKKRKDGGLSQVTTVFSGVEKAKEEEEEEEDVVVREGDRVLEVTELFGAELTELMLQRRLERQTGSAPSS